MTPVRIKPAAPRSRVKHSTTEPLHSLHHIKEVQKFDNDYFRLSLYNAMYTFLFCAMYILLFFRVCDDDDC